MQIGGGHRIRQCCNDTCKQRAYLERKENQRLAALRTVWAGYLPETQAFLVSMTQLHSEEFARRFAAIINAEKQQSSMVATSNVSLMDLGKRLDYPELHVKHPSGGRDIVLREGFLSWQHFYDVAEGRVIRAAMEAVRAASGLEYKRGKERAADSLAGGDSAIMV